jgi:tRNA(fMet)-specific endonuclease VapC
MYLLDADACIGLLRGTSPALAARLRQVQPGEIRLSSLVKAELYFGARRSDRVDENLQLLSWFFDPMPSLPFDDRCAEHYGSIRAQLAAAGTPIGPNDLLIAATARANDLTLVSRNTREFARVVGLRVEDWGGSPP